MRKETIAASSFTHYEPITPGFFYIGVSPWPKTTHKTIPSTIVRRALGSFKLGQAVSW